MAADLGRETVKPTGREGLSAETILRAAIVKQNHQFSYADLAIYLNDSNTFSAFCRLGGVEPSKSALQEGISRIKAETWEKINRAILVSAKAEGIETGQVVRTDSTPVKTDIHKPMDSELLWDAVRVISRMMVEAKKAFPQLEFCNRTRACKKRLLLLRFSSRKVDKKKIYREMIRYTDETIAYMEKAIGLIPTVVPEWAGWIAEAQRFVKLARQAVSQTKRRVLDGEKVPACDKIFSLFEEHTDIIVKGRQDITYGHKVNLTMGRSGMVLDLVVEDGNPADSDRAVPMIERQVDIYGVAPRQCVFDGAYGSRKNLAEIKDLGVKDSVFQKKKGLMVDEMAKSPWVYRKLRTLRHRCIYALIYLVYRYWVARFRHGSNTLKREVFLRCLTNCLHKPWCDS